MRFIGNKTKLLPQIQELINDKCPDAQVFCDLFSGTCSVSRYLKKDFQIITNDLLYLSFCLARGSVAINEKPTFDSLLISDPFLFFNTFPADGICNETNFVLEHYAPAGNRMYLTNENAKKIDFIRQAIERWRLTGQITEDEYFYILACLIEAIPSVSNIAGTYGAYNKFWDKRSFKQLTLKPIKIISNKKDNRAYNEDAADLIKNISGDILYLDPPYNARQYISNYHLLETVARYDAPKVHGKTGLREGEKSLFCSKRTANEALKAILHNADFRHVIISYSTDGILEKNEIIEILLEIGNRDSLEIRRFPYRQFKSNQKTDKRHLEELLFYIRRGNERIH